MPKPAKPVVDIEQIGTLGDLAIWAGLSMKSVREYAFKGLFVSAGPGRYKLVPSMNAYCEFLRKGAAGRSTVSEASRARLLDAQAQQAEAKAGLLSGKLLLKQDMDAHLAAYLRQLRSMMLALPSRVGGQVPGLGLEVMDIMDREVRNILTEMAHADYESPSDHRSGGREVSHAASEVEAESVD